MTPSINKMRAMYVARGTVTQAVREILTSNKFYREVLQSGIANVTALAEKIKPEIENMVDTDVTINTVLAAIKRLSDHLDKYPNSQTFERKILRDIKFSLTDSVFDVGFEESEIDEFITVLFDRLFRRGELDFYLFQTSKHCSLFTANPNLFGELEQKFAGHSKENKLTKITLEYSEVKDEYILTQLLYEISNILYSTQIKIHSAFFTNSEITFIVENRNAIRLYDRIQQQLLKK